MLVAALSIPEINAFPPYFDEWFTMHTAGWLEDGPYSPAEVVDAVKRITPDHMPGYVLLLSAWGSLTGWEVELGRVFSIFAGLMYLGLVYRVARDFVAPVAGLMALILIASIAFYNYFYPYMRMYTVLPLSSGLVLWLYLRIVHQQGQVKQRDYLFLGAAVYWLLNTHLFCAVFLLSLGLYHLLFAPKNLRWLSVSTTIILAVIFMVPNILPMTSVVGILADDRTAMSVNGLMALHVWLTANTNGQSLLLLLAFGGLLTGLWKRKITFKTWLLLPVLYLTVLAFIGQFTSWIEVEAMNYHLANLLPFVLLVVNGLYAYYRLNRWLLILVLCWVLGGLVFHASGAPWRYTPFIFEFHSAPPTQNISRMVLQENPKPLLLGHSVSHMHDVALFFTGKHYFPQYIDYSQFEHYFERRGIVQFASADFALVAGKIRDSALTEPSIWLYSQPRLTSAERREEVEDLLVRHNYELCDNLPIGPFTVVDQYMWKALECVSPRLVSSYRGEIINYEFFGLRMDASDKRVYIMDKWTAAKDVKTEPYKMSYQLLSAKREKVAQLDLPLVHPEKLRMFFIDVSMVESDDFELVAIVYHSETGERRLWLDEAQGRSEFQPLSQVAVP